MCTHTQNTETHTSIFSPPSLPTHLASPSRHFPPPLPSMQVNASLELVDYYLGLLVVGLQQKGILNCVNIIVTSDHGTYLHR